MQNIESVPYITIFNDVTIRKRISVEKLAAPLKIRACTMKPLYHLMKDGGRNVYRSVKDLLFFAFFFVLFLASALKDNIK